MFPPAKVSWNGWNKTGTVLHFLFLRYFSSYLISKEESDFHFVLSHPCGIFNIGQKWEVLSWKGVIKTMTRYTWKKGLLFGLLLLRAANYQTIMTRHNFYCLMLPLGFNIWLKTKGRKFLKSSKKAKRYINISSGHPLLLWTSGPRVWLSLPP